ncbi:hypothetical protein L3Q82_002411 [Scortum barcoo]|uniref:Uncharacterized protein n=1 Tax=Scortum barcoo TaxID=214431 RepID=A0ACB8VXT0_9TELE|nr:hypothetical protein L3Q82_002411 [Scortum barcoo]
MAGKEQQRPARNGGGDLASTDEEGIMTGGAAADGEETSATYAGRGVTGLPTVPREKMTAGPGMPAPIRSLTEPRGRRGHVEREEPSSSGSRQGEYSSSIPLHVYEWKFPLSLATDMLNMAHAIMPEYAQFVSPEQLHCTAYVSQGPDPECDKEFSAEVKDSLHCSALFWSVSRSVISVTLSSAQQRVFLVENSHPHIALSKSSSEEWKDLGLFTLKCNSISDWEPTGDTKILCSPSTALQKVPSSLWARGNVPVDPNSQFWFAFNFNGRPYIFTRLCQGYCESPTLYNEALRDSLAPFRALSSSLIHGKNLSSHDKVTWTREADQAFSDLKLALQSSPTLGLPDPTKPFTQAVDERDGCMTSVLLQTHGDKLRPVAYFSAKLDPVAAGHPRCLRAVAAAEKALLASRDIVGYAHVTLLVPHAVSLILLEQKTSHLSAARWLRYHTLLLDMPNHQTTGDSCFASSCLQSPALPAALGDFVVVKDFRRKHCMQAKACWHGPFQILLTTHMAVKVAEREQLGSTPATAKEHGGDFRRLVVILGELDRAVEGPQAISKTDTCSFVQGGTG